MQAPTWIDHIITEFFQKLSKNQHISYKWSAWTIQASFVNTIAYVLVCPGFYCSVAGRIRAGFCLPNLAAVYAENSCAVPPPGLPNTTSNKTSVTDKLVELNYAESISHVFVQRFKKQT